MKKNNINSNNTKNNFFSNMKLYSDVYKAGSMISLSNEKHLMLVLKKIGWRIVTLSLLSTKETSRFRMLHNFGVFIIKMNKNHGPVYTVKYLKACQLAIQKKLAGQPFSSLREIEPDYNFPRLSKSGLPSVIKTTDRSSICNNSFRIIRLYLSLFSIYRIIKIDFSPKLNTITDKFEGSNINLKDFNMWLERRSLPILQKFQEFNIEDLKSYRILPILKSSPQGTRSYTHLIGSYIGLKNSNIFNSIKSYLKITKSSNILTLFRNIEFIMDKYFVVPKVKDLHLGRLSFKEEAAGKLRVFAMVDVITQSILEPLHSALFRLFKKLPNDCTHDQDKGFKLAQSLSLKYNCSFGFDLSAATDRLPISSQAAILNSLFGIGHLWADILVNRDYNISSNSYGIPEGNVRYSVGQPMGALSSWAMLNLVHHMMIQFIAAHLGKAPKGVWYSEYVILGDDLVLFDKEVAWRYLSLCKELGVSINLSKSIVSMSKPVLEFAKRTSVNGVDVSALPFKELLSSDNFFSRLALTTRLIRNSWGKNLYKILVIGNKRKSSSRIDAIYPMVGLLTQAYQKGHIPLNSVLSVITNKDKPLAFFGRNINWMSPVLISKVVKEYLKTGTINKYSLPVRERFFSETNTITFKNILLHRIGAKARELLKLDVTTNRIELLKTILDFSDMKSDHPSFYRRMITIAPFAEIFFVEKGKSVPDLKALRFGLDIDLALVRGPGVSIVGSAQPFGTYKYYLELFWQQKPGFYNSKIFIDLKLEDLLAHLDLLTNKLVQSKFYNIPKDLNKDKLDNPLKVLDFIKDIHDPKYKVSSDFVLFDGNYTESEAPVDKAPGFKPEFNFGPKRRKYNFNIKIISKDDK
nr:MAG: RNA-dependent RNA polymerase [Leptosphaeria biglobosa mitovirus 6]